jgi:hypothetical protein
LREAFGNRVWGYRFDNETAGRRPKWKQSDAILERSLFRVIRSRRGFHFLGPDRGMHRCTRRIPVAVILAPETSLISPAGQDPSSTLMRWPSRRSAMSCSRDTCWAIAEDESAHSTKLPTNMCNARLVCGERFMFRNISPMDKRVKPAYDKRNTNERIADHDVA